VSAHCFSNALPSPDVLGELLHCLSQPLTSLRCALELSIDEVEEQWQENVASALHQTERMIGMVQLMREYLDAEQHVPKFETSPLAPVVRSVIEELSSIAKVRHVRLRLAGTCTATISMPEPRLRLVLQYLIAPMVEAEPVGGAITLYLSEQPREASLRAKGKRGRPSDWSSTSTLQRVRLTIASRMLEGTGASLAFRRGNGLPNGFVLRIPCRV
jgi:signal transduction histidine kinase